MASVVSLSEADCGGGSGSQSPTADIAVDRIAAVQAKMTKCSPCSVAAVRLLTCQQNSNSVIIAITDVQVTSGIKADTVRSIQSASQSGTIRAVPFFAVSNHRFKQPRRVPNHSDHMVFCIRKIDI